MKGLCLLIFYSSRRGLLSAVRFFLAAWKRSNRTRDSLHVEIRGVRLFLTVWAHDDSLFDIRSRKRLPAVILRVSDANCPIGALAQHCEQTYALTANYWSEMAYKYVLCTLSSNVLLSQQVS